MLFQYAVAQKLAAIVVQTDDLIHLETVLADYCSAPIQKLTANSNLGIGKQVFYTLDQAQLTIDLVDKLRDTERTAIFVNCKPQGLAFDAGVLMPLDKTLDAMLRDYVDPSRVAEVKQVVRGLTLKSVEEIMAVTLAKFGGLKTRDIRYVRSMMTPTGNGLYPVDTDLGFYEPSKELRDWLKVQGPYLMEPTTPVFMLPRGVLMAGPPGVGKTMGAKYIAKSLGVPLYRLDIATTLTRWLGDSEARISASLQTLDKEEPCVVLLDEVEKVFNQGDNDNAALERMLSQLLWWLQEHTSRVLVVMTTNNLQAIPPELYREGRIDIVIHMPTLTVPQAISLAHKLLKELLASPSLHHMQALTDHLKGFGVSKSAFSHAEVRKLVVDRIKEKGWKVKH